MKNSKDWYDLVGAMVGSNFYNQRVIEGEAFKLHVVVDGDVQGIIVKQDGKVLFKEIFHVPKVHGRNYKNHLIHYENGGQWLKGESEENIDKFLSELRDVFFSQVILGTKGGENFKFYCPDVVTLQKWAKVLNLRALV